MYNIVVNTQVDNNKWYDLIRVGSFISVFQTPEFYQFYNSIVGFCADVFAAESNGEYLFLVTITIQKVDGIKAFFSRRGIIYGGPIVRDVSLSSIGDFFEFIGNYYRKKLIYLETRNLFDYTFYSSSLFKKGWKYEPYLNFQIPLRDKSVEDIYRNMKYNRRREIQLSFQQGTTLRGAKDKKEVSVLYDILRTLYHERVKLPLPKLEFFMELYNSAIGKIFIVMHNNRIIGGSFCLYFPNTTIYTMYYVGIRDYHPKIFPTHLAIQAAIEFGLENKLKYVDLMGAGKPHKEYGVRNYKSEFGGELVEHGRFIKINSSFWFKLGKLGLLISQKI